MVNKYNIAGLIIEMNANGRIVEQSEPYQIKSNKDPDIKIEVEDYKNRLLQAYPRIDMNSCEYLATGASFYKQLLRYDGFMLHSSAVVLDGNAYLFTADSGTGKSTHTSLWLKQFGNRAYILNDDKPAVRLIDGKWYAFGTPWSGKHDISVNTSVPVKGVAIIERNKTNIIERVKGLDAIIAIMRQTNRPRDLESRALLLELLDRLFENIPIWKLQCNMEPEAAIVAYEAMSGEKWEGNK